MLNVIGYLKFRYRAWQDYYHVKQLPDRLLEDIGLDRQNLDQILKGTANR